MENKPTVLSFMLLLVLIVFQYATISMYSATPASQSSKDSLEIVDKVIDVFEYVSGDDSFSLDSATREVIHHIIRKLAHVTIFFVQGFLNVMLFYLVCDKSYVKAIRPTLFMGFCGASFDECLQLFVEGRAGMVSDVFVDMVGVCGACFLFSMLINYFLKKERVFL